VIARTGPAEPSHVPRRSEVALSSTNCSDVLAAAGIDDLFDVRIDGLAAEHEELRGKPAPDTFLAAAAALGSGPATPQFSRMRLPESQPAGLAGSALLSESTGPGRPTSCVRTGLTS
jgi:beta-phosphoglucomutase-like phosphatase (HAD superfamily)